MTLYNISDYNVEQYVDKEIKNCKIVDENSVFCVNCLKGLKQS
jgi:hypothetical protein